MSQFGQPPLAAYLPLRAGQNLADLPDKPAALANLGTLSTSDIMLNSVPIGTIIPFWGNTAPVGYLPCNGQTVNSGTFPDLVTFLGGGSSQVLPDLRGEFLRGWDNGRGIDIGRAIKTWQADDNKSHNHSLTYGATYSAGAVAIAGTTVTTGSTTVFSQPSGGSEARPRNIAVLYCMKAYGALVNTSTANMGNVLTELSQCTKLTQFGASLADSGYQKLPGGLIIQWGRVTTAGGSGSGSATLPIAFPTAVLSGFATSSVDNGSVALNLITTTSISLSGITHTTTTPYNQNTVDGTVFHYLAIGY